MAFEQHPQGEEPAPVNRPLQIFLLVALLVSGAAYLFNQFGNSKEVPGIHALSETPTQTGQKKARIDTALGEQAENAKHYLDAVQHYRAAVTEQNSADGRLRLGRVLLAEGNPAMAFSQFQEAVRLDPNNESVYLTWGRALQHQGKAAEAEKLYQDAVLKNNQLTEVHYNLAQVLMQRQQAERRVAEINSDPAQAALGQADANFLTTETENQFASAQRQGFNTAEFWRNYGQFLLDNNKLAEAESALTRAVNLTPASGPAQFALASVQLKQGNYGEAVNHYSAALAAMPDDPATLNQLALLYATAENAEMRSPKMAVLLGTRACDQTSEQNSLYMDTLARAYAADGDFFQAIAWEDKAVHRAQQLGNHELLRQFQTRYNLFLQHKTG